MLGSHGRGKGNKLHYARFKCTPWHFGAACWGRLGCKVKHTYLHQGSQHKQVTAAHHNQAPWWRQQGTQIRGMQRLIEGQQPVRQRLDRSGRGPYKGPGKPGSHWGKVWPQKMGTCGLVELGCCPVAQTAHCFETDMATGFACHFRLVRVSHRGCTACATGTGGPTSGVQRRRIPTPFLCPSRKSRDR